MLDKLRSRLVHFGPSLMSVPVKLTPFALKRQVLEQVLSWQFSQALADGEAGVSRRPLAEHSCA